MQDSTKQPLLSDKLIHLIDLVKDADSIELKATLPERSYRSAAAALDLDPLEAQIRQVFFLDTPELSLNAAGVVVRARRIQGRAGDTVVKLRPVVPSELPADLRGAEDFAVEVDVSPDDYVCSGTMKRSVPSNDIKSTVLGERPIRKLFSKEQRALYAEHAPAEIGFDDLSVLGPIFVLKLKTIPDKISRRIVTEMWFYPDGSRVVELSTKCLPGEGIGVAAEMRGLLASKGIDITGEQATKTKTALEFFAAELRGLPQGGQNP